MRNADLDQLALQRLRAVLGEDHAMAMYRHTLDELGLTAIDTPQQLMQFSESLTRRGGFVGTLGALLGVAAVMRGASPTGCGHSAAKL